MEYQIEEVLPVVSALTDKFTSKESSSVTYETAQMLMEAVLFCIEEYAQTSEGTLRTERKAEDAYHIGYEKTVQKVCRAKEIYDCITEDFQDYGCQNYRSTLIEGMPKFFLRYDAKFRPQNHLLTLDYPTVSPCLELRGVDCIYHYLYDIRTEQQLLECFLPEVVSGVLRKNQERHKTSYMGNLCELVLFHAIGCIAAGQNLTVLNLEKQDLAEIDHFFSGDAKKEIEGKIQRLLHLILDRAGLADSWNHFQSLAGAFAVRIEIARTYDCLENLFF